MSLEDHFLHFRMNHFLENKNCMDLIFIYNSFTIFKVYLHFIIGFFLFINLYFFMQIYYLLLLYQNFIIESMLFSSV